MKFGDRFINKIYIFIASMFLVSLLFVFLLFNSPDFFEIDALKNRTIDLYFADNISPAQRKIIQRFNDQYRDKIRVIPINLPFNTFSTNERKELLSRSLRSKNNRIDVLAVDYIWLGRFAKWAEPLDDFMHQNVKDLYLEYALQACNFDGKIVSMPFYIDIGIMFYRKDLLNLLPDSEQLIAKLKASISWNEFIELEEKLSFLAKPFYIFPADHYEGLVCSFMETVVSQNGSFRFNPSLNVNTPAARTGLNLLIDLIYKYNLSPAAVTDFKEKEAYTYAFEKDAIFIRGWPGNERDFEKKYPQKVKNLGIAALPHFADGRPAFVYGGWNLMISASSDKKDAAMEFLKFTANIENQKILYEEMGLLPTNKKIYTDSIFISKHPELVYLKSLVDKGFHRPKLEDYTKKSDVISYYINQALRKIISAEQALAKANQMILADEVLIR